MAKYSASGFVQHKIAECLVPRNPIALFPKGITRRRRYTSDNYIVLRIYLPIQRLLLRLKVTALWYKCNPVRPAEPIEGYVLSIVDAKYDAYWKFKVVA